MTTIEFKTTFPLVSIREKMITELNKLNDVNITGEFIAEIPRHNLMRLTTTDSSLSNIFELGRLVQALDNPNI